MAVIAPVPPGIQTATKYTPSQMRVVQPVLVRRERKLPRPGDIMVHVNQHVPANAVIGRARMPAEPWLVAVGRQLGVTKDITRYLVKQIGDDVNEGDIIAAKGIGPMRTVVRTPVSGTISTITPSLGQVSIMPRPHDIEVLAGITGTVLSIIPARSVIIESAVIYIQGTAGNGREGVGLLKPSGDGVDGVLLPAMVDENCRGQILFAGHLGADATTARAVIANAAASGVAGIIAGSMDAGVYLEIVSKNATQVEFPIVVIDGFGNIPLMEPIWELLKAAQARVASILYAEGGRYEQRPPEIMIPLGDTQPPPPLLTPLTFGPGSIVRILRGPYPLGTLASVAALPDEMRVVNGVRARVVEVEFADGSMAIVPRNNVQLIG